MDAVKTGIEGLDSLFADGGLPRGNSVLLLGGPGAGKTIFATQYLYEGATQYGENGIFVSLLEHPDRISEHMARFGWDLAALGEEGKLTIIDAVTERVKKRDIDSEVAKRGLDMTHLLGIIEKTVKSTDAKRVVIDAISALSLSLSDIFQVRTEMLRLSLGLAELGTTALIISESPAANIGSTEFPVETFLFDGIITLHLDNEAQKRKLAIRKMRGAKHAIGSYNFDITDNGIRLIS
ncbi:MAG: circadian clock protein KaiC [Methanobacteriota archaeon]|nr:MAG: circadian clock protein KaiC [Euryarchaeota archaeon]